MAYRPAAAELVLAGVLCFKYQRTVAKDNTVRFNDATFQLLRGPGSGELSPCLCGGPRAAGRQREGMLPRQALR